MLIKELYIKNPYSERVETLKDLKVEDSAEFSGFLKVEFFRFYRSPKQRQCSFL